ncbi:bifunctional uridylate/adenylate kinase [Podospora bellae-mahoneyi]|uniref:Uridylate kinase n=1 Tax=Podospora bellae-mahoneyi TaxID=2093777 RepID=A0ABR0FYF5_9PEZI|nr:bifunctional uridylate/adenylate kinase [Podospora bellae-mahoneyi]
MSTAAAAVGRQAWRKLARNNSTAAIRRTISLLPKSQQFRPTSSVPAFTANASKAAPRFSQSQQYRSYSSGGSSGDGTKVKFWPFVLVLAAGTGGWVLLINRQKNMPPNPKQTASSSAKPTPAFSPSEVTVLFVLGGPGAGKGTQCANLVNDFSFHHLSAGDLLRAEQDRPGSQYGQLIQDCIKNGAIVPMEVTVALLENAMADAIAKSGSKKARFLIDGFPRKMDQAFQFEKVVCPAKLVLFFDCPEQVMEGRLLERGKTSGRADDNAESIRKRFRTFVETSMPVVEYYDKEGKVIKVDATPGPKEVYEDVKRKLVGKLGENF